MDAQPGDADQVVGIDQRIKAQEFKNTGNDKFNKYNYKGAIVDYNKGSLFMDLTFKLLHVSSLSSKMCFITYNNALIKLSLLAKLLPF